MPEPVDPAAVLCYVKEWWSTDARPRVAYFTTAKLDKQWGDDWNDAPYDCNAGDPYLWDPEHPRDLERWSVYAAEVTGPFETPAGVAFNTPFAVEDVNTGVIAWLWESSAPNHRPRVVIPAGTTFKRFAELVAAAGGTVGDPAELKHWREEEGA